MSISSAPIDLLAHVFTFLLDNTSMEELPTLSRISKHWQNASKNALIDIKQIIINLPALKISGRDTLFLIGMIENIRTFGKKNVTMHIDHRSATLSNKIFSKLIDLFSLNIQRLLIANTNIYFKRLNVLLIRCVNLQHLYINSSVMPSISSIIKKLPLITLSVNATFRYNVRHDALIYNCMVDVLSKLTKLKYLKYEGDYITPRIADAICKMPNLITLSVKQDCLYYLYAGEKKINNIQQLEIIDFCHDEFDPGFPHIQKLQHIPIIAVGSVTLTDYNQLMKFPNIRFPPTIYFDAEDLPADDVRDLVRMNLGTLNPTPSSVSSSILYVPCKRQRLM